MTRIESSEIVAAYQRTGSVWKAGKELGIAGQTVHERLRALGHPLVSRKWDEDELDELRALAGHVTVGEIARRLGRPYQGVAQRISRLGIGSRYGNRIKVKTPRGAGYDKVSVRRHIKEISRTGDTISRYARRNGLGVEGLCQAIERTDPDWWVAYRESHSDLAEIACVGCGGLFIPSNKRQEYCSRRCAETSRRDREYFGGRRNTTIGLAEQTCQLCGRTGLKGLSSHHILGKENDPENLNLIALCAGCHKIVTLLATRTFVDDAVAWQSLIALTWFRRHGDDPGFGVYTTVEIEELTEEDVDEIEPLGAEERRTTGAAGVAASARSPIQARGPGSTPGLRSIGGPD